MTENEIKPTIEQTIYCLKAGSERYPEVCAECQLYGEVGCDHCYDDTNDMAIKCLKQLGQYRAIGTVEELKSMKENGAFTGVELAQLAAMQMRLKEYSAIGTIEEFKALKEKSVPRKIKGIRFESAICPRCESELFETYWAFGGIHYCSNCGQTIDWQ